METVCFRFEIEDSTIECKWRINDSKFIQTCDIYGPEMISKSYKVYTFFSDIHIIGKSISENE